MIDPDNFKESILNSLEWTEHELKEFLRKVIADVATKHMTFDPYTVQDDLRFVVLSAILYLPSQSFVLSRLRDRLAGTGVQVIFDYNTNESAMMNLKFKANRFKAMQ